MKKTFFILYFLLLSVVSFGNIVDSLPIKQNLGSSSTLVEVPAFGALRAGIAFRSFTDTTQANTTFLDDYPFMVISTTSDGNLWMRNAGGTAWIQLGGGSISPTGNFWALGGNTIYSQFIPRIWGIGALTQDSIGLMTSGVFRLKFYSTALPVMSASNDSMLVRSSNGYVGVRAISGGGGGSSLTGNARYALKANGVNGSNVWLGQFYPIEEPLYKCFYEWIVRVDSSGYIWSDGYGGSHDLLFGFSGNDTAVFITGNMYNSFTAQSFGGWDAMMRGTVHHVAVSFTGSYIITWIDGVPSSRVARTLARQNVASSGCGGGYFLGSDHQNADCTVFQMRAYEFGLPFYIGDGDCFHPDQTFTPSNNNVVLCINVDKTNNLIVNDLSAGFWGQIHTGFLNYNVGGDPAYPPSQTNYLNYPEVVVDSIVQGAYTGATNTSAAKVYDRFERADQVPFFQTAPSLDSTQGGSLGKKKWEDGTYANSALLYAGIINRYAYFGGTTLQNYKKVLGDSNNQDVRVTFANTTIEVNVDVLARVQDDNNKILGRVSNGGQTLTLYSWIGGVFTTIGTYTGTAISEVKLVVSGTTATLYGDGVSRVSGSVAGIPSSNYSGFGCNSAYSRVKIFEIY